MILLKRNKQMHQKANDKKIFYCFYNKGVSNINKYLAVGLIWFFIILGPWIKNHFFEQTDGLIFIIGCLVIYTVIIALQEHRRKISNANKSNLKTKLRPNKKKK
jgi:hypothetical protein